MQPSLPVLPEVPEDELGNDFILPYKPLPIPIKPPPKPPKPKNKVVLVDPANVKTLASLIHSSVTIDDLTIRVAPGNNLDELLQVPIAGPGMLIA